MASRFRSFFGKTSTNDNNLKGQSYDNAVALDPPVKGSYPVAGNGPNVLEEIQRTRAKRASIAASTAGSIAPAPAPSIPRQREETVPRPRTAPNDGELGGGQQPAAKNKNGRTLSGFSMKSPPSFLKDFSARRQSFSNSRRNSIKTTAEPPPPLPASVVPAPFIPTYQPKTGSSASSVRNGFALPSAPFTQHHNRNISTATAASHKSHIDLLDAHSNINRTREASKHRTKASGFRNYGEDVADRNIADHGEKHDRDSRLDLNSPEFSYLKQVYSPKKRHATRGTREPHSRVDSALSHILGSDGSGDDTQPQTQSYPRPNSIRSFTGPRTGVVYPPRTDSAKYYHSNRTIIRGDDERSIRSNHNGTKDRRERAMSPLSSTTASIYEAPRTRDSPGNASQTPPIPERGRARALSTNLAKTLPPMNPAPAPFPTVRITSPNHHREFSGTTNSRKNQRTMSMESITPSSPTKGGSWSRKSSISYSAFPPASTVKRESQTSESVPSSIRSPIQPAQSPIPRDTSKREGMIIKGASEPPDLNGVVDLKDSVDTDVFLKTLPGTYPRSAKSRNSIISRASSFTAPYLSPLHITTPHDINELPSFPPANWPLPQSPSQASFRSWHSTREN